MSDCLFNYSSVVVDDLPSTVQTYEKIGLVRCWQGEHPLFRCKAALLATGKGGTLLLAGAPSSKHPALAGISGSKERNFHIGLVVKSLSAQLARCRQSSFVRAVSDEYAGPSGRTVGVELEAGQGSFWVEFTEGLENLAGAEGSRFECVDSTAMVARKRSDIIAPLESLGLRHSTVASDGYFRVLEGINEVILLDWHYLEVNEPTKDKGAMANFLARLGRPGIFGINYVPRDMREFVTAAKTLGLDVNTPEPILLMVEVRGKEYRCADIITINPRSTGGARIFVLKPLEYPWQLGA